MTMTNKEREKYFNSDGSIKRLLEVVEILPDGTRVFENGWTAAPSKVDYGDSGKKRLDSMSAEDRRAWEDGLMNRTGHAMSDHYRSLETGAGRY